MSAGDPVNNGLVWRLQDSAPPTTRGQQTKQAIVEAAEQLFRDRDYHAVAIEDIARAARVSVGSFYRYFGKKEWLFSLLLSRAFLEMFEAARAGWSQDSGYLSSFQSATKAYLTAYRRNRYLLKSGHELAATSLQIRNMWLALRDDIYGRMETRLILDQELSDLPRLDSTLMMRALGCMMDEYARRALLEEEYGDISDSDLEAAANVLGAIWFRSLFGAARNGRLAQVEGLDAANAEQSPSWPSSSRRST